MAEAELRNMIMNFRVSDLQVLLGFAGRNKTGKKNELQSRALDLLKLKSSAVYMKVRELHSRRYHHHQLPNSSYDAPERINEVAPPYEVPVNNFTVHCNPPSLRPVPALSGPSSSYTSSNKAAYLPSLATNNLPHYNYRSTPNIIFKELPFYDVMHVVLPPSGLPQDQNERFQESNLRFFLTPQQAQDVAMTKNAQGVYEVQLLLRFCLFDANTEQEDNFPPNVCVKVNSKSVTLPNPIPTNRPGVEPKRPSKPVNITSFTKLSPIVENTISVSWSSTYGRSYAMGLFITRQLTAIALLQRVKGRGLRDPEHTTSMVKEKLQQGQDADIATTSLRGSLLCPVAKVKMEYPCRALTCSHLQCFDALSYLRMNEKKPKWICPVCDKPALFKNLAVDGLFVDIASKVPPECTEVQFHEDGSWTHVMPVKEPPKEAKKHEEKNAKKQSVEVVDISDSDDSEVWDYNLDPQTVKTLDSPPLSLSPSALYFSSSQTNSSSATEHLGSFEENFRMPTNDTRNVPDLAQPPEGESILPSTSTHSSIYGLSYMPEDLYYTNPPDAALNGNGTGNTNGISEPYDFLSLLQMPDMDPQKHKDLDGKDPSDIAPDVISLD